MGYSTVGVMDFNTEVFSMLDIKCVEPQTIKKMISRVLLRPEKRI